MTMAEVKYSGIKKPGNDLLAHAWGDSRRPRGDAL
jgi:hypothetical protein